ncbi:MAG: hypothetical protein Q4C13_01715, partial [Clostridia bacterium]|nr:hypothetical protein [Clostridia bacterium]
LIRLVEEEFGVTIERESKYDLAKVKRDKAAAEAKRAAESTPDIEALAVIPADSTGAYSRELLEKALVCADQLEQAADSGASISELRRLRHRLNAAVAAFLKEQGRLDAPPAAFRALAR